MRIKTMFTILAIAFAFIFASFSPPVSAKTSTNQKNMKILIVGNDSLVGTVMAQLLTAKLSVEIICIGAGELKKTDKALVPPILNKSLLPELRDYPPENTFIARQKENKPTFQPLNYRQPPEHFFNGFNNPARGKI